MNRRIIAAIVVGIMLAGCEKSKEQTRVNNKINLDSLAKPASFRPVKRSIVAIDSVLQKSEVPVLCYHQVRDWTARDSKSAKVYIVPVAAFRDEMKALHDSGYHTILPDQLLDHLMYGDKLPAKPIMLTFDDADGSQVTAALPELDKYGFKGVFFIMTVVLNRPNYMSRDQVKSLYAHGHTIGCHTWDHHMVTKYTAEDWVKQVEKPRAELEKIIGRKIKYFAYPFGLWNDNAVTHLKGYGFDGAFQLASRADHANPLLTIRRQIADGNWNAARMMKAIARKETPASVPAMHTRS